MQKTIYLIALALCVSAVLTKKPQYNLSKNQLFLQLSDEEPLEAPPELPQTEPPTQDTQSEEPAPESLSEVPSPESYSQDNQTSTEGGETHIQENPSQEPSGNVTVSEEGAENTNETLSQYNYDNEYSVEGDYSGYYENDYENEQAYAYSSDNHKDLIIEHYEDSGYNMYDTLTLKTEEMSDGSMDVVGYTKEFDFNHYENNVTKIIENNENYYENEGENAGEYEADNSWENEWSQEGNYEQETSTKNTTEIVSINEQYNNPESGETSQTKPENPVEPVPPSPAPQEATVFIQISNEYNEKHLRLE